MTGPVSQQFLHCEDRAIAGHGSGHPGQAGRQAGRWWEQLPHVWLVPLRHAAVSVRLLLSPWSCSVVLYSIPVLLTLEAACAGLLLCIACCACGFQESQSKAKNNAT